MRIELFRSYQKVNYYTLVIEENNPDGVSETEDFFGRFEHRKEYNTSLNNLVDWIEEIGDNRGANSDFFRPEDKARALPPPSRYLRTRSAGKLRLYCILINEQIVILANGDEKTANAVKDCPDLLPKFRFANSIARQLEIEELKIQGKKILNLKDIFLQY